MSGKKYHHHVIPHKSIEDSEECVKPSKVEVPPSKHFESCRSILGLTLADVSVATGIVESRIDNFEKGDLNALTVEEFVKMAAFEESEVKRQKYHY